MRRTPPTAAVIAAALTTAVLPAGAAAQLPAADAGALGLGTPSPALARGFAAVAANPAALGAPDGPGVSATVLSLGLRSGLDPVTLGDVAEWEDRDVPHRVRMRWLEDIRTRGSQAGAAGVDVTLASVTRGRLGAQVSTRAHGDVLLNPDAAELLLFGNAGLDGTPRDFELAGSRGDGWIVTTAAVAYGRPVGRIAGGGLHAGGTLTFSVGHALGLGRDNGSGLGGDPTELDLRFPVMHVGGDAEGIDHGHGLGLDVGVLWITDAVTVGATAVNVFNTFDWDLRDLSFRPGAAVFDPDESSTDFDERPAEEAPPVLLDALEALTFRRGLAVGAAWRPPGEWTLTADLRVEGSGGMTVEPDLLVGVGAEYRSRENLPLRAGIALIERGVQLSTGLGLELGRFGLTGAAAVRVGALDDLVLGTLGASFRTP